MNARSANEAPGMPDVECQPMTAARDAIAAHPYFRGRVDRFQLTMTEDVLVVEGTVPSFYLKQVLTSLLHHVPGIQRVSTRIEVVCPVGLSGCSLSTREQCEAIVRQGGTLVGCFPTCPAATALPQSTAR